MDTHQIEISTLKRHPYQESVYLNEPVPKIKKLAKDIEKNGQRVPVEVTPDNIIIDGHCRVEAAKLLGWETVLATVIQVEGEAEMRQRHLDANVNRRHLEKIDLVRLVKANMEFEYEGRYCHQDILRELIAETFGQDKGDPSVRRYLRLVRTPNLIQEKFKSKELKLMTAIKFDTLDETDQENLLKTIEAGEVSPESAFDRFLNPQSEVDCDHETEVPEDEVVPEGEPLGSGEETPHDVLLQYAEYLVEDIQQLRDTIVNVPSTQSIDRPVGSKVAHAKGEIDLFLDQLEEHRSQNEAENMN